MNPLELPGPKFLLFYVVTLAIAVIIATLLRRWLGSSGEDFSVRRVTVDPYEAAYLRGGAQQVIDTAIAMLVQSRVLKVSKTELSFRSPHVAASHPVEQAILKTIPPKAGLDISKVKASLPLRDEINRTAERLKMSGLVLSDGRWRKARKAPALVILTVLLFGIAKILIGVSRDRPISFLLALCILTGIIALWFHNNRPDVTPLGKTVLKQLKEENAALEMAARTQPQRLAGGDVALALGLFGISALAFADDSWSDLRRALQPPSSSSTGGSSCSSSSCGSSCGGGCGGGGCGGCGS
jgi:uncharacterized protein (TIGR04222 family)